MPRRLPVRPAKVFGNFFVLIVLSLMGLIWYTFVMEIWMHDNRTGKFRVLSEIHICLVDNPAVIALLIVYNFFFVMLVWSFF